MFKSNIFYIWLIVIRKYNRVQYELEGRGTALTMCLWPDLLIEIKIDVCMSVL